VAHGKKPEEINKALLKKKSSADFRWKNSIPS